MRFDISDKIQIQMRALNHFGSLMNLLAAFHFFGTDIQQGNPRSGNSECMSGQNITDNGKLGQINRAAFGIGTQIKHNAHSAFMRNIGANGRTMNSLNGFQNHFGNCHQRSGITGRNHRFGLAFAHSLNRHIHTGIFVANNL